MPASSDALPFSPKRSNPRFVGLGLPHRCLQYSYTQFFFHMSSSCPSITELKHKRTNMSTKIYSTYLKRNTRSLPTQCKMEKPQAAV